MGRQPQGRLLGALLLLLCLLLGYPAVLVVEAIQHHLGRPVLPVWVFGVWALIILAAAVIVERPRERR